jgi:hypothetical protein
MKENMRLAKNVITHIPAQPEWYVIEPIHSNQKIVDVNYNSIIAWLLESQEIENNDGTSHIVTTSSPITSDGDVNFISATGVRQPCGKMFIDGEEFTSQTEIIKEMNDQEDLKRQHLANQTTTPSAPAA